MIILTAALHYDKEDILPFYQSLELSGFSGKLVVMVNDCKAASFLSSKGVHLLEDQCTRFPINTRRFKVFRDFLQTVNEPCIICDIRDIVFQHNPEHAMPTTGVNVFCEWEGMNIGKCPYNSQWMQWIFGRVKWEEKPIICAGVTSGNLTEYTQVMWKVLSELPPKTGLDQAIHNDLVYSGRIPAKIWANEDGPVYTVGYIPRETIPIVNGMVHNKAGLPCMIHQYDRHRNLKGGLPWL